MSTTKHYKLQIWKIMDYKIHNKMMWPLMSHEWKVKKTLKFGNNEETAAVSGKINTSNNIEHDEQYITTNDEQHNMNNHYNIYIEDESPNEIHVTINNINTVHVMNAGQININLETGKETNTDDPPATCHTTREKMRLVTLFF